MLQNTDRGAPEPPTGSYSNSTSSDRSPDSFESGAASATDAPFGAGVDASERAAAGGTEAPRKRRRGSRGGRRRGRAKSDGDDGATSNEVEASPEKEAEQASDGEAAEGKPARKRSRRGRRGSGSTKAKVEKAEESGSDEAAVADEEAPAAPRKRTRRKRKTAARAESATKDTTSDPDQESSSKDDEPSSDESRPRRRRRGSRGGRGRRRTEVPLELEVIPGEEDDLPDLPELPPEAEVVSEPEETSTGRKKRGRKKTTKAEGATKKKASRRKSSKDKETKSKAKTEKKRSRKSEKKVVEAEPEAPALILVNASDEEEQRVAVVQEGQITDFSMTSGHSKTFVNDIYRGRVVNLEPAIGAAFVDFGQGRNGFLHTSDVLSAYGDKDWKLEQLLTTTMDAEEWDEDGSGSSDGDADGDGDAANDEQEAPAATKKKKDSRGRGRHRARPRLPITDLLKKGQMVVVQVTKDAIGDKGPTLTTYISIPGRYLVLMPSMTRTGVSRKIEDEKERRRLKRILESLDVPPGMGVIVRTAGVGRTKADLKRDLTYLKSAWEAFGKQLRKGTGPSPLYRESDVAIRTIRDLFTPNTEAVYVDDPEVHAHLVEFTQRLMPENVERVQEHKGPRPLFHTHGVEQDFEKLFARRIELPSGGSIVFDQTEALVAIDVNSGRTRTNGTDFEEIALKTNLEAAPEIARQIRLRDLGGIIVCDFIDMMRQSNMRQVERVFKAALSNDRARSKVGRISQFGLLELTRQRLGPGLTKKLFHTCSRCRGTGRIRNVESRAAAILRRLGSALTLKGFTKVEVRAHPEVVEYLEDQCSEQIRAFEYLHQREITLTSVPEQPEDSVLRYLRADGREVRPGGRRKR